MAVLADPVAKGHSLELHLAPAAEARAVADVHPKGVPCIFVVELSQGAPRVPQVFLPLLCKAREHNQGDPHQDDHGDRPERDEHPPHDPEQQFHEPGHASSI